MMSFCMLLTSTSPIQSALHAAGPQAARIERLWWLMFWVAVAVFVLVIAVLSGALSRSREKSADMPPPLLDTSGPDRTAARIISAAIVITVATLFVLLVKSVIAGKNETQLLVSKNPVSIQVVGYQWWWEITYQNSDASQTLVTANEIHIPIGVPVVINTAAHDVIHSFWVPNLNGKRDLIPGYSTAFWIQADRPGVYRGQCAEFCGIQHAKMAFYLVAESNEDFQKWLQQQLQSAPEPDTDQKLRGREVFLSSQCVMCHTIRGTIAGSRVGPDLTHIASRTSLGAGTLPNNVGNLAAWIADPQGIKPGCRMPPNELPPEDQQALLAYLESLQ